MKDISPSKYKHIQVLFKILILPKLKFLIDNLEMDVSKTNKEKHKFEWRWNSEKRETMWKKTDFFTAF